MLVGYEMIIANSALRASQRVGDVVPGVVVWSCIVITAGPHQQLLPLPNLLYQIKYDDDDDGPVVRKPIKD